MDERHAARRRRGRPGRGPCRPGVRRPARGRGAPARGEEGDPRAAARRGAGGGPRSTPTRPCPTRSASGSRPSCSRTRLTCSPTPTPSSPSSASWPRTRSSRSRSSAETGRGLAAIGPLLASLLAIVRVYSKVPGHPPDSGRPFTLRRGGTVREVARQVHRGRAEELKFARIWGPSVEFDGQQVSGEHVVADRTSSSCTGSAPTAPRVPTLRTGASASEPLTRPPRRCICTRPAGGPMVIIDSYAVAVGLCLITMLCWGSWANTLKLTPKDWPFPLYYWDYAIGLVLTSLAPRLHARQHGRRGPLVPRRPAAGRRPAPSARRSSAASSSTCRTC